MSRLLIAQKTNAALQGEMQPPGDKSISHRIIMLGALAEGITEVRGWLAGEDNVATAEMMLAMGAKIEWLSDDRTSLRITGVGLHGLCEPQTILEAGNSGTCARLMLGILAAQNFHCIMQGDHSLCKRPMLRVISPLRAMGAHIDGCDQGSRLPIAIRGQHLKGMHYDSPVASAQVKSCVLLAGLFAEGKTSVTEPRPTRDHTERMLPLFGQPVAVEGNTITIEPTGSLVAPQDVVDVPSDPSSCCFFAVAASLIPNSCLRMKNIGMNDRRDGWRRILLDMGADISLENERLLGDEPVADIVVRYSPLHGVHVNPADVPDAIDEFPVLFVAASLASGEFVLSGAEELRVKESDRISVMVNALKAVGANVEERPDGVCITGQPTLAGNADIDANGDHRIAMAMAIAAQCAEQAVRISGAETIATSFPMFVSLAKEVGMTIEWSNT
ncbi:MAG: 3-phosphoshikimate 1-carboxyvinyltransferase [Mariprofundaceae bacterium]|nr:3-phosphoshikimate 1-carboxyvinyltransferase [Mariprofundaceae bacterium]